MNLAELERSLVGGIDPLRDQDESPLPMAAFQAAGKLSPTEALAVYRNNITSARVRALESVFPVCRAVLGSDCFSALARDFCWLATDTCADLNGYGEKFPAFLAAQDGQAYSELPYLQELAQLEWHWHAAFYAADPDPFPFEEFAAYSEEPERVVFLLADGLSVLQTNYPVREIWQRHRVEENTENVPGLDTCEYLCICRVGDERQVVLVEPTCHDLLANIIRGDTLSRLSEIDALAEALPELLPALIGRGWISGFKVLG